MSRDTVIRVVVVCQGGLVVYTLYALLSEPDFPWALMMAVVVVSAALMFLLRDVLFGGARAGEMETQGDKSNIVFHGVLLLAGSVLGLLASLLSSYLTNKAIQWETYVGMLVPMSIFAIALWMHWLRHRRGRIHS